MQNSSFLIDSLKVNILENAEMLGKVAASEIRKDILSILEQKKYLNIMFAAAPSQNSTLEALKGFDDILWNRVNVFHMDEYVGIFPSAPQSFRNYLENRFFKFNTFHKKFLIKGEQKDSEKVAEGYDRLLRKYNLDLIICGIGENGHIAFNDPPEASFDENKLAKVVSLSQTSRIQQVHDGCFDNLEEVPKKAITVTIPAFLSSKKIHCVVPGKLKSEAVRKTLQEEINEFCPASILRNHSGANLYIDTESASKL